MSRAISRLPDVRQAMAELEAWWRDPGNRERVLTRINEALSELRPKARSEDPEIRARARKLRAELRAFRRDLVA